MSTHTDSPEPRSGLAPWTVGELPHPPLTRGLGILGAIGPGAVLLGVAIGSGEWLLGPAAFIKYGLSLLWVTSMAVVLQTLFNTETLRYTMYTGEPITVGFMRTRPGPRFWAIFYALLFFFQVGWPGWAGAAASAIFYLFVGRMAGPAIAGALYWIGLATFLITVLILLVGPRIERTLEIFDWMLITLILGGLLLLCLLLTPPAHWAAMLVGFIGFDLRAARFDFLPAGGDWFLIGAFAAYSGGGGVVNLTLSHWARDKGFGMGQVVGYIPAAVSRSGAGLERAQARLSFTGAIFRITPEALRRWRGWWRIAAVDQWGVFCLGSLLGMGLPALLYTSFIPAGQDIRGLAIAATLADAIAGRSGIALALLVALIGAWLLFKTQIGIVDGMARAITDLLWAGSRRVRNWRGGDVRGVYYSVLAGVVIWGLLAMRLLQPIILLQLGGNMAGVVFVIVGLHTLRVNTTLLPPELRPPLWRRISLVLLSLFYGVFVYLWLMGGFVPDPSKGFLFNIPRYLGF